MASSPAPAERTKRPNAAGSALLAIAAFLCSFPFAGCSSRKPARSAAQHVDDVLAALANGDIEAAEQAAMRGKRRYPQDGRIAVCVATVHDMLWRDDLAIAEWREIAAHPERAGWTAAEARGRLGDQLFAAGRYGESVAPLLAGSVDAESMRRRALLSAARELPFRRKPNGPLVTEQPLLEGSLPEFACSIGDLRRAFAVDTGSSMTTIARSLAEEANARAMTDLGTIPDGTGLPVQASVAVLDAFAVGEIWFGPVPALVVEEERLAMRDLFGGPERPPIGVLGLDLLSLFRMTLDPVRKSLVLEMPRGLASTSSVQCVRSEGRCLVPVTVAGERLWFVLDTGASHSSLTAQGLHRLPGGDALAVPGYRRVRTAGGGGASVREVRNVELRVSQVRFPSVDLPVVSRTSGSRFPVHGVLGIDLMRQCRVTFDGGRARMEPGQ